MNPIRTAFRRTQQALREAPKSLKKEKPCALHIGAALEALPERLCALACKKPLLLVSEGEREACGRVEALLQAAELPFSLWEQREPLRLQDIENIRLYALGEGCDSLVAVGVDSVLMAGKLAALRLAQADKTAAELMSNPLRAKRRPLLLVSLTAESVAVNDYIRAKDARGYWTSRRAAALRPTDCWLLSELLPSPTREELLEKTMRLFAVALEEYLNPQRAEQRASLLLTLEALYCDLKKLAAGTLAADDGFYERALSAAEWQGGYALALAEETARVLELPLSAALAALLPPLLQRYRKAAAELFVRLDGMVLTADSPREAVDESADVPPTGEEALPLLSDTAAMDEALTEDAMRAGAATLEALGALFAALDLAEMLPAMTEEQIRAAADKVCRALNPRVACPLVLGRRDLRALLADASIPAPQEERSENEEPKKRRLPRLKRSPRSEGASTESAEAVSGNAADGENAADAERAAPEAKRFRLPLRRKKAEADEPEQTDESSAEETPDLSAEQAPPALAESTEA